MSQTKAEEMLDRAWSNYRDCKDNWKHSSPKAILEAQRCVELSQKAVLQDIQGTYKEGHDPSTELIDKQEQLPKPIAENLPRIKLISGVLADWRNPAQYGYEESNHVLDATPSDIFGRNEAELAKDWANEIVHLANRAIHS